jgi:hypothetical protein
VTELRRDKDVPWNLVHRLQHARVADIPAEKLLLHHLAAFPSKF